MVPEATAASLKARGVWVEAREVRVEAREVAGVEAREVAEVEAREVAVEVRVEARELAGEEDRVEAREVTGAAVTLEGPLSSALANSSSWTRTRDSLLQRKAPPSTT